MHFTKSLLAAAIAATASAATHQIQVGTGGERVFEPATVNAAVGDTVQFIWVAGVCLALVYLIRHLLTLF